MKSAYELAMERLEKKNAEFWRDPRAKGADRGHRCDISKHGIAERVIVPES